jgi:hypothetical protein
MSWMTAGDTKRPQAQAPADCSVGGMSVNADRDSVSPGRYASLVTTASSPATRQAWTRRPLACGVVAGPVFVTVFLFEGAVREGYRPLRHPVSSLAIGSRG